MSELVNYQKRGVQLPAECKDLIDVLKRSVKAGATSPFGCEWEDSPRTHLIPGDGFGKIESVVSDFLGPLIKLRPHLTKRPRPWARLEKLSILSLDNEVVITLYHQPSMSDSNLLALVPAKDEQLRQSIWEFLVRTEIDRVLDYQRLGWQEPPQMLGVVFPLPEDAKRVTQVLTDLLTQVYGLDHRAGMVFRFSHGIN